MFEKMTGISEEYITEAALVPAVGASPARKPENRFAALSRALNSGWGVACICFIVAIAAVVGILHWGLPGASVNPFPPAVDPNAPRYVYSMGSLHSFSHGESVDRPVERGEDIYLTVSVQNNGPAFQIRDSEWAQLSAVCVLQGDDSVTLEWRYSPRDGGNQPYWVQTGATETLGFVLTIPENATPGVYDLVLSYDGVKQVFGGALTVGDPTEEFKPPYGTNDLYVFSFGYEPYGGVPFVNSFLHLETWVRNDSEPFTFTGSSMGFAPHAVLLHRETGYRIEGMFDATTDYTEVTVNKGDVGRVNQEFFIPVDAPTGIYDLVLSFYGATQTFENVLTVAVPTVIAPAVLYNLTMSIGSDWLYEPIDEAYADGEEVTVRIKFATDVGTLFFLNGEVIDAVTGDDQLGYWEYSFIMPQKDSQILFQTYDGTAPYYKMLEACICSNPYGFREDLFYYYGEFGDGVMVALQLGYGEAIWSTAVGGYTFVTPNTHDMMAFHDGTLYELQTAYDMGLLTDGDLEAMQTTHMEWFPYD